MPETVVKLFSKSLTDTDIRKRLAINPYQNPTLFARNGAYKKPVFSNGWKDFVVGNDLNVGDQVTLYRVMDEASCVFYRIDVEKPARPSTPSDHQAFSTDLSDHQVDDHDHNQYPVEAPMNLELTLALP
ncbi:hypothetical protein CCACVL1_16285 [Corchorus capsularis]|uniref:TF-B3 domain-containing protein n=1 Tax=Corchorus capsularis TaxID=210143 RepID=A0A1R3HXY2_COCAP|nr:hypothetical protein CCACVL1_16285 [Corchorus capsularis]